MPHSCIALGAQEAGVESSDCIDGLMRRGAELRERSAQVRAEAARIMARSAELIDIAAKMQGAVYRKL